MKLRLATTSPGPPCTRSSRAETAWVLCTAATFVRFGVKRLDMPTCYFNALQIVTASTSVNTFDISEPFLGRRACRAPHGHGPRRQEQRHRRHRCGRGRRQGVHCEVGRARRHSQQRFRQPSHQLGGNREARHRHRAQRRIRGRRRRPTGGHHLQQSQHALPILNGQTERRQLLLHTTTA